ncbi:glycogen debranching enzyme [Nadsonia fulvescens var. elongata DSM 6958]|uniref:Glycogen debranching enzyme n=1 Tax=Nadsonia fulvescens var. elongata DSM 6958 TaxID=857566 RepID=A0A1E3PGB2_9ASCO|nr:glycogen debranching enzyme [Nadsonia fulvescens var. elongata DSM 6958]
MHVLVLADNGEPSPRSKDKVIQLPPPTKVYRLRFLISSISAIANQGSLWLNLPPSADVAFDRHKFYQYPVQARFHEESFIDVDIHTAGTFAFYWTFKPINNKDGSLFDIDEDDQDGTATGRDNPVSSQTRESLRATAKHYFVVQASLELGHSRLPFAALNIESVVSKWMGPLNTWPVKLDNIAQKGYNMIHFTPLQERGSSNSPYSIFDFLQFDSKLFPNGEADIADLVHSMEHEHQLLALTDVVFNHAAHNATWLTEHPEAGYSVHTAPHLTSALALDTALLKFSNKLKSAGLPTELRSTGDLDRIIDAIKVYVIGGNLKLWEFYVLDVDSILEQLLKAWENCSANRGPPLADIPSSLPELAALIRDQAGVNFKQLSTRFAKSLDNGKATDILAQYLETHGSSSGIRELIVNLLDEINLPLYREYDSDLTIIIDQLYNRIKYTRLDEHGPRLGPITPESPLIETYFSRIRTPDGSEIALANNGWIWNGNPLVDFAGPQSKAYLCREVIIWGDCVKLRYGESADDSPFLWDLMKRYVQLCARYFHGLRIDNCHSTPLHVGEYLLDQARLVRPNLFVVAELFTGSEEMDKIFVERLGIASLIREAMQAWSVEELSRLVHRHGGRPIGSFSKRSLSYINPFGEDDDDNEKYASLVHHIVPLPIGAMFMDCTHDNETPAQKRTVEDTLPNAALVAMCASSIGSVMGYDECYPRLLDIVQESRQYSFQTEPDRGGIGHVKAQLAQVHRELALSNAEEMHVHHEGQYITIHRLDPRSGNGYFLIARTKFQQENNQGLNTIYLHGQLAETKLSVHLSVIDSDTHELSSKDDDKGIIKGIATKIVSLQPADILYKDAENMTEITLPDNFPQGSIILLKTRIKAVNHKLDKFVRSEALNSVKSLSLVDLNVVLYRCNAEERDVSAGADGTYGVPNYGQLTYAGLQGWISAMCDMVKSNDLGHPIAAHLRQGTWALDYVVNRLNKYITSGHKNIQSLVEWLKSRFEAIRPLPDFLRPRYFAMIIYTAYAACQWRALSLMSSTVRHGTLFLQQLAMTSIQMIGLVNSASILPFDQVGVMAAGLPHFSTQYMRCWGRDVFISLRGLCLVTGRYDEALSHILAFARTLKHGLIPNLLDSGRNPRYNARDATWLFLQACQDYYTMAPNGKTLLEKKVPRRFPLDDTYIPVDDDRAFSYETSIHDIIYEILSRHAKGIHFREANAGPALDSQMKPEGFNIDIEVDWADTGLIFGGSQFNCGTWMDKMGESERAGNKGVPGTPRDGAAIEISGLLKSTLRWVNQLRSRGEFNYDAVTTGEGKAKTLEQWEDMVQASFEKSYYIPLDAAADGDYDVDAKIVNRRGIYKDLYRSGKPYEDYQLRPNFALAMTVAPELFVVEHARQALVLADAVIRGPVGMRTLDPSDLNYRPDYINGVDNDDFATSKGRNYHQGPEWIWCTGYFLRSVLHFGRVGADEKHSVALLQQITRRVKDHRKWILNSPWAGLTELTNKDGALCFDSSPTQCWSTATLLDVYQDVVNRNV